MQLSLWLALSKENAWAILSHGRVENAAAAPAAASAYGFVQRRRLTVLRGDYDRPEFAFWRSASIDAVLTIPSTLRASFAFMVMSASACSCVRATYSAS